MQPSWQPSENCVKLGQPTYPTQISVRGAKIPVEKILANRRIKQHWVLRHQRHQRAQIANADIANVYAPHQDLSRGWLEPPSRQQPHRTLARTIQTYECHSFTRIDTKAHPAQHRAVIAIRKPN